MGSKSSAPAAPNYSGVIDAFNANASNNTKLAQEQFDWAKAQGAKNDALTERVVNSQLDAQRINQENAAKDRARYEGVYQPLEDSLVAEAKSYASPERKDLEMGRAQAGVGQAFDAARANAQQQLESYGINPGATRFAALDIGMRAQQAAAQAAAGNQAAQTVDNTGRALRSEALGSTRGYGAQSTAELGQGVQSGSSAVNNSLTNTSTGASTQGTGVQYAGLANSALSGAGNAMNSQYQNQSDSFKNNQSSSSGLGSALGLIGGIAGTAMGGPLGGSLGSALGGALGGGGTSTGATFGRNSTGYGSMGGVSFPMFAEGGDVPEEASPTGGAAIDDVDAKLTSGEFIIPKSAVEWYGQKYFHNMIAKAEQERVSAQEKSGAVPTVRTVKSGPPALISKPTTTGAVPYGQN